MFEFIIILFKDVLCLFINLVVEWIIIFVLCLIGLNKYGVLNVLLIINGILCLCVIFVNVLIFIIFELGFFNDLINIVFVLLLIVFLKFDRFFGFINVVVIL